MPTSEVLSCVYFALFFIGVGYALFIVITGGLHMPDVDVNVPHVDLPHDIAVHGADVHVGGPELPAGGLEPSDVSVSPLSPITIATFVTVFGGVGVITTQFAHVSPGLSLAFAAAGGLVCSGLMFVFYSQLLIKQQATTQVRRADILGLEAEVTVPIGEDAPGQVSYTTKAGRMSSVARSVDGQPIERGRYVKIVRVIGPQVLVERIVPGREEPHDEAE